MDKLSSLSLSFDRVLVQIIVPGLIAIFPFFLLFLRSHPDCKAYFYSNPPITITAISLLSLISGLFLENLGGRWEKSIMDTRLQREYPDFDQIWKRYLQCNFNGNEPVGQSYFRNIVLRMKFELSAGIAMVPMTVGLWLLHFEKPIFTNCLLACLFLLILPVLIALYLLCIEAPSSARILAETRALLVSGKEGAGHEKEFHNDIHP